MSRIPHKLSLLTASLLATLGGCAVEAELEDTDNCAAVAKSDVAEDYNFSMRAGLMTFDLPSGSDIANGTPVSIDIYTKSGKKLTSEGSLASLNGRAVTVNYGGRGFSGGSVAPDELIGARMELMRAKVGWFGVWHDWAKVTDCTPSMTRDAIVKSHNGGAALAAATTSCTSTLELGFSGTYDAGRAEGGTVAITSMYGAGGQGSCKRDAAEAYDYSVTVGTAALKPIKDEANAANPYDIPDSQIAFYAPAFENLAAWGEYNTDILTDAARPVYNSEFPASYTPSPYMSIEQAMGATIEITDLKNAGDVERTLAICTLDFASMPGGTDALWRHLNASKAGSATPLALTDGAGMKCSDKSGLEDGAAGTITVKVTVRDKGTSPDAPTQLR